jgi:2,3-dimethylmalate lyase
VAVAGGHALHARIAQAAGAKAFTLSGAHTSSFVLGLPDSGFLTMPEIVENARRVCQVTDLPVIVDCDTGHGNAVNVRRTVAAVIKAGAAGLFIEDQVAPKRCGFVKGKELVDLDEAIGKYRAALDARDELDPDFVIMSRTDSRGAVGGSLEEAVRRLRAYKAAGVDVVYAEALQSMDEVRVVRQEVEGPLYATLGAIRPRPTMQDLQDAGLAWTSVHVPGAESQAIWDAFGALKREGPEVALTRLARLGDHALYGDGLRRLLGSDEKEHLLSRYSTLPLAAAR